ncbi:N-acetylglucosamine kinase [Streptomyces sp. PR69]|uniref:N-acetylglucosamine kinase n=1 Tax=Streptomyces sp. PR69 TaxID=2984950 RepID=UPI00226558BF|nr:BadF/BadG/BcrA/BcrD ATPase family protein [Streptomyces sp. PR69]
MTWVLGVDSGGSGLRAALAPADDVTRAVTAVSDEPVRTGPDGADAGHLLRLLLPMVRSLLLRAGDGAIASAVLGAAGMASLGGPLRARLPDALSAELGVRSTALAADGVTAYAGALGQRPGAVVAAGTGMIALGTDLYAWRRADGWGHLLGDAGGGAWIGRAGLEAALRAHDGRRGGSAALLARAEAAFGPAEELPERLYPRPDRPAVLASFAPEVAACADDDPVAAAILTAAARHIADTAAAVCPPPARGGGATRGGPSGEGVEIALTGGLFKLGEALLAPLRRELAAQLPHARLTSTAGDPLSGALLLASALHSGDLRLPPHPTLLYLPGAAATAS